MKQKNGFTITELLAVLTVLSLIIMIAVPSISGVLEDGKNKENMQNQELAIKLFELYLTENKNIYQKITTNTCYISTKDIPIKYQIANAKQLYITYNLETKQYQAKETIPNDYSKCL